MALPLLPLLIGGGLVVASLVVRQRRAPAPSSQPRFQSAVFRPGTLAPAPADTGGGELQELAGQVSTGAGLVKTGSQLAGTAVSGAKTVAGFFGAGASTPFVPTASGAVASEIGAPAAAAATGESAAAGTGGGLAGGGAAVGIAGAVAIGALMVIGIKGIADRKKAREKAKQIFQEAVFAAAPVTINGATGRPVEFNNGQLFLAKPGSFIVLEPEGMTLNQIDFLKGAAGPITGGAVIFNDAAGGLAVGLEASVRAIYRTYGIEPTAAQIDGTLAPIRARAEQLTERQSTRFDAKTGQVETVTLSPLSRAWVRQGR